jgi:hypothetical protein
MLLPNAILCSEASALNPGKFIPISFQTRVFSYEASAPISNLASASGTYLHS